MATTPVILYTSAGMPIGSYGAIAMYRPTATAQTINGTAYQAASPIASGGLSGGAASLGNYLVEKMTLSTKSKLVQRMDAVGTDADKTLLRSDPTLSCTVQCASLGTPSLMPGDCFEAHIGYTAASTSGSPASIALSRWFLVSAPVNFDGGDPTKFQCTFDLDRQNSASTLAEF